jgi:hypothetical protein
VGRRLDHQGLLLSLGWLLASTLFATGVLHASWWTPEDAFHTWAFVAAPLALVEAVLARRTAARFAWLLPAPIFAALFYLARPPHAGESVSRLSLLPPPMRRVGVILIYLFVAAGAAVPAARLIRAWHRRERSAASSARSA